MCLFVSKVLKSCKPERNLLCSFSLNESSKLPGCYQVIHSWWVVMDGLNGLMGSTYLNGLNGLMVGRLI